MLSIGEKFPAFELPAVITGAKGLEFATVSERSFPGKWKVLFFWPGDFTTVCPTEVAAFARANRSFLDRDAQVIGGSIDSKFVHLAWRQHQPELEDVPFPLLSDVRRELCQTLGILTLDEGVAMRATFIVDPQRVIRHVSVNDLSVGRNVDEVIRILDALQTDELCPCNWKQGEATLGG